MLHGHSSLREFGNCRLDVKKKLLWSDQKPVQLPLKAVELLCVLVEGRGAVITKEEIWHEVWNDSFVEETNLTHNIYTLRKALNDLGHPQIIETVPRRGYRFCGKVHEIPDGGMVLERHAMTQTTIEFQNVNDGSSVPLGAGEKKDRRLTAAILSKVGVLMAGGIVIAVAIFLFRTAPISTKPAASDISSLAVLPVRS
ncbi:MAG TPA: winged helix-turn-helix domain-containing protein, partial [Nitrososphaera sp.]|nr:winged helix-turn-helix domain-containing protein [Nitrososphaera sp.]